MTIESPAVILYNEDGTVAVSTKDDDGVRRLEIAGVVVVQQAAVPLLGVAFLIHADTPLVVSTHDTIFVIPDGKTAHVQSLVSGNEDPTKGAVAEVIYDDDGTERLIARMFTAGASLLFGFANVSQSRDGTDLTGNGAGTKTIIVRRTKFVGTDIAIDTSVRGYTI
jgi:hypothetical protein